MGVILRQLAAQVPARLGQLGFLHGDPVAAVQLTDEAHQERVREHPRLGFVKAEVFDPEASLLHDLAVHRVLNRLTDLIKARDERILFERPTAIAREQQPVAVMHGDDDGRADLRVDGVFALEVMEHINKRVDEFKYEDGNLYAIYGTPAENLCGLQIRQFREQYGIIEGVSDRPYVSNSFHCHVSEDITPIQKQDLENRFWDLSNGGKIQYVKYPIDYNMDAIKSLIRRAMDMGFYEGVNLSLSYCDDCGHEELQMDVCPKCGSKNLTKIDRMNGYLSYSRVHGDTRLNAAKMAEIADRKSM